MLLRLSEQHCSRWRVFLVLSHKATSSLISNVKAVELLGTMLGGYNIEPLIADDALATTAVKTLSHTLLHT